MAERRPHPTVSDVALALATRQSQPLTKFGIEDNASATSAAIKMEVADPDPSQAYRLGMDVYKLARAELDEFTAARQNGEGK